MKTLIVAVLSIVLLAAGCGGPGDSRIHTRAGVGSDTMGSNIVTGPVTRAFSALIGEGIVIDKAVLRRNKAGLMEVYVNGHNDSYDVKRFRYRVEWLDSDGLVIETKTSVWLPASAMGKSPFSIKAAAPRPEAVDFRMDTRKWE